MGWQRLLVLLVGVLLCRSSTLLAQEKKSSINSGPELAGHNLEYWIAQIANKDQSKSEHALQMVILFGPERAYQAVPAILDRLRRHSPGVRVDASVRVHGVMALGFIWENYKGASPQVTKDAVNILKRFLTDDQRNVRLRAAEALAAFGTDAKEAIPEVISLVRDPETFETRKAAVTTLGHIALDKTNGPSAPVLKALLERLGGAEGSMAVRLAAIQSLTWLGPPANSLLKQDLIKALDLVTVRDSEVSVRIWGHMAVINITGAFEKERVEAIAKALDNPEPFTRVQALQALGTLGKEAKVVMPRLLKSLNDPDPPVVAWTIWVFGQIGPPAAAALPALERYKMDTSPQMEPLRKMAEYAVEQITAKKK